MLSTCAKQLQSLRYFGFHFTQVPHTYSVSQPLPSHVSLSRNRHRRIAEIDVHTQGLDISLLLCCQLVPNCFNHWGILDCTLHRYPTHIPSPNHCHRMCLCQGIGNKNRCNWRSRQRFESSLVLCCQLVPNCFNHWGISDCTLHRYPTHIPSPNHCHRMCLCQGIGTEESLKLTFIHKGSRFHCLYAVNLCPTASIIEVFWIPLYTRTPHTFCLPTTAIACVFVKE